MRSETWNAQDDDWMRQAVALAQRGEGYTRPNPPVGALVVRDGKAVGSGWHRGAGGPHAEIHALRQAGEAARGATLYITLEPCSTQGRTGPCTQAILAAGLRRVVIGATDPNPRHCGRGVRQLRRGGIEVLTARGHAGCLALIEPFRCWITTGRSFVTLKLAATLDGRIADATGQSRWITGPQARAEVQRLRRRADVVMVGIGTALADDPALTCRTRASQPLQRVIVDSRGRLPLKARVLTDGQATRTIIATTRRCAVARRDAYARCGATVWILPSTRGHVAIPALLERLSASGYLHVLCEGGAGLAGALLEAHAVNSLQYFVAPSVLGAKALGAIGGPGWRLSQCPQFTWRSVRRLGRDVLMDGVPAAPRRRAATR